MSRVGKYPVAVPQGVTVEIAGAQVTAKGKLGSSRSSHATTSTLAREGDEIVVKPRSDSKRARTLWGTVARQHQQHVRGVSDGLTKRLEITGVGYRAAVEGSKTLVLQLGYSHEVRYPIPQGIRSRRRSRP